MFLTCTISCDPLTIPNLEVRHRLTEEPVWPSVTHAVRGQSRPALGYPPSEGQSWGVARSPPLDSSFHTEAWAPMGGASCSGALPLGHKETPTPFQTRQKAIVL